MIEKILVGTTADDESSPTLAVAARLAVAHDAELVVLRLVPTIDARHVFDPEGIPARAGLSRLRRDYPGLRLRTKSAVGDALRSVCDTAADEKPDWIVVGQGRGGRGGVLSRRAGRALVERAAGTVLLVAS